MRIKPIFEWYDLWIGVFIDTKKKTIYVFPLPTLGLVITVRPPQRPARGKGNQMNTVAYYRRTNRPYAFLALVVDHVEVTTESQTTGPADSDWQAVTWDGENVHGISSSTEPMLIADELICELAIRRFFGAKEYSAMTVVPWAEMGPDDLDDSGEKSHESLCDVVEDVFGTDAGQRQRIALRSRMSSDYCGSHSIDQESGEYV